MTVKAHPSFHKWMLDGATHPAASRRIKFEETRASYLYKTGAEVFKFRKPSAAYSSLAVKEALLHEALTLGCLWAPSVYAGVAPVYPFNGSFSFTGVGAPVDIALRQNQVSDHQFADYLVAHGKLNPTALSRVARFLALKHAELPAPEAEAAEAGRPETFAGLVEEVFYQIKKYYGVALNPAMFDLIARPTAHFLEAQRRIFVRRQKKKRIVRVHGAFLPEHVYVKGAEIEAISPQEAPLKLRYLDAASDVAQFKLGLNRLGAVDLGETFVKRYASAAKDRDVGEIVPAYQVLHCAREGLLICEWLAVGAWNPGERDAARTAAEQRFSEAIDAARTLPH